MTEWATVRPARLAEALHRKLADANGQMSDLWNAEQPRKTSGDSFAAINHFLMSARGVFPVARTFGEDHLPKGAFFTWLEDWERKLTAHQRELWEFMKGQRDANEHGDGAELITVQVELLDQMQHQNTAIFGIESVSRVHKSCARFAAYPDRPASDVCRDYYGICNSFVEHFLVDHASAMTARANP